jgi:NAD(P)H-flavin reductase
MKKVNPSSLVSDERKVYPKKKQNYVEITLARLLVVLSCLFCGVYFIMQILMNLENGVFCPRTLVCAKNSFQISMLVIAKFCAGIIFPLSFTIFISKASFSRSYFANSFFSEIIDFSESHQIHAYAGIAFFFASVVHGIAHIARYLDEDLPELIYKSNSGWSGIIGLFFLLLIVIPMAFQSLRDKMSYEIRKGLHFFAIPMLLVLMYHSALMFYVMLGIFAFFCVDYLLSLVFLTFRIDSAEFESVGQGVAIKFSLPSQIDSKKAVGQYVYMNIPWIAKNEWHAFSLMFDEKEKMAGVYIYTSGDFTKKLLQKTIALKKRPTMWINGPHPSPFMHSAKFSKLVLIASGAGITPAISVIQNYSSQRQIYLIFITNDGLLVRFFKHNLGKVKTEVFFTGSKDRFEMLKADILEEYGQDAEGMRASDRYEVENWATLAFGRPNIAVEVKRIVENDSKRNLDLVHSAMAVRRNCPLLRDLKEEIEDKILQIASDDLSEWSVMYCGASKALNASIMEFCKDMNVKYISEYFANW